MHWILDYLWEFILTALLSLLGWVFRKDLIELKERVKSLEHDDHKQDVSIAKLEIKLEDIDVTVKDIKADLGEIKADIKEILKKN